MGRNHEICTKSRRNVSKKYRKLTSSDDETERCRKHSQTSSKPRKCTCCVSDNEETEEKKNFRKRMISILSPAVSHKNLATILSTDNSELFQSAKPKPGCDDSRKSRKKCSKHAPAPNNERQKTNSRVRIKHNENCRKKVRHQCTAKPPKRPVNPPKCLGCSKEFDSPILLSCGHTLCRHCVAMFVEASDGSSFKCPVCETEIRLSGDEEELFCPNFMTLRQMEDGGDDSSENLLCAVCQSDIEADYYCDTCQDLLCCNCANAHQVVKYTKGHRVRDIDCSTDVSSLVKKRYYCVDHEKELLNTFCVPCQKCLCQKCANLFHSSSNHHCIPINSATEQAKDEMRRQLYEFKSRSPNLQVALMDLQNAKKTLKEQANETYAEISDSMARIITALKEHEKKLHKRLEDVCQTKVYALKSQKHQIVNQLERYETFANTLQQLAQHDNNIEMLQMRATINTGANFLEKDPVKIKCSQSSIFFNSNELKVKSEIEKHGEIFHITSNDGRPKNISHLNNERNDYIISNFTDRISFPITLDEKTDLDLRKNAKKIRAKSNWKILRSRLPEVINSARPLRVPHRDTSRRRNTRKKQISRAKREKARANWMILRSHISDVTESESISPRSKPWFVKPLKKQKINYRSMRVKALRQRANANWLLLRSMISDIVDFGRVTGRVFSPMKFATYKQRSSPTIMKLKRFRAKKLRARANWLLVASRVKDIVKYPEKLRCERVTWDSYLNELNLNRRQATRNKYVAGVLRARANWMIVRSRIPDIILYGKYQQYSKKKVTSRNRSPAKNKMKSIKRSESERVRSRRNEKPSTIDDKSHRSPTKHRSNDDEKRRKHHSLKIKSPRHSRKGATQIALENWSELIKNTQSVKKTPSVKPKSNKEVYKSWDNLIQGFPTSDMKKRGHRTSSVRRKQNAYNNWDNLTTHTNTKNKQKSKESLDNWDQLVKKTKGTNVQRSSSMKSKVEAPLKNWDILIQNTSREIKQKSSLRSRDAFTNWDNLLRSKNTDPKKSLKNWDHLIVGTSTLSSTRRAKSDETLSRPSQSDQHWHHLFNSAKHEKRNADKNWHRLTGNALYEKETADRNWDHLVRSTKTNSKPPNRAKKNWNKIKTSLGRNLTHKTDKDQPVLGKSQEDRAYKNWWTLISTDEEPTRPAQEDIREKAVCKTTDDLVCGSQANDTEAIACQNWNSLIQGTDTLHAEGEDRKTLEDWYQLISGTQVESINKDETVSNWHNLIRMVSTTEEEAVQNWHRLIQSVRPTADMSTEAEHHWHNLVHATKSGPLYDSEKALYHWDKLLEGRIIRRSASQTPSTSMSTRDGVMDSLRRYPIKDGSFKKVGDTPPSGFRLLYDKTKAQATGNHEPKVMRLNIRNDFGQFSDVRLKITSPNTSMLSAHLKENTDGTFTIFCCPSIDEPFNICVSLGGSQFEKDVPVLSLTGDLSQIKSQMATRLACKTISLIRWHLTPGLLAKQGEKIVAGK